jgi:hypothetical protein
MIFTVTTSLVRLGKQRLFVLPFQTMAFQYSEFQTMAFQYSENYLGQG